MRIEGSPPGFLTTQGVGKRLGRNRSALYQSGIIDLLDWYFEV